MAPQMRSLRTRKKPKMTVRTSDEESWQDSKNNPTGSSSDENQYSESSTAAKKKKVRKETANKKTAPATETAEAFKRVRGCRGLLGAVNDMPEDILYEIFSWLEPLDLLHLSRTSKDTRAFLMTRRAEQIWRVVRTNVEGLPPIPGTLSEPAYVNFMFDSHCHICLQPKAVHVDWQSFIRVCKGCLKKSKIFTTHTVCEVRDRRVFLLLREYAPRIEPPLTKRRIMDITWHIDNWLKLKDELEEIIRSGSDTKLADWRTQRQRIMKESAALESFIAQCGLQRKDDLADLRRQRREAIIERLSSIGWDEELKTNTRDLLSSHKSVNQPKALTERIWKNIEPGLIEFMQASQDARLLCQKEAAIKTRLTDIRAVYHTFVGGQLEEPVFPPISDVVHSSPFHELIFETPSHLMIEKETFVDALETNISSIAKDWRDVNALALQGKLRLAGRPTDLALAGDLRYDAAKLSVYPFLDVVRRVIESCGLDAETATMEDMNLADVFLTCTVCNKRGSLRDSSSAGNPTTWAMRWIAAVGHWHPNDRDGSPGYHVLTDPKYLKRAWLLEAAKLENMGTGVCKLCKHVCRPMSWTAAEKHLLEAHNIEHALPAPPTKYWRLPHKFTRTNENDVHNVGRDELEIPHGVDPALAQALRDLAS